jgi:hypothetical protein
LATGHRKRGETVSGTGDVTGPPPILEFDPTIEAVIEPTALIRRR